MILDILPPSEMAGQSQIVVETRLAALERRLGVRFSGLVDGKGPYGMPRPGREPSNSLRDGTRNTSRVLVVDDNKDAANILAELLNALGYDATTDYHPHAALDRVRTQAFDAFVLDIGLPELDGHALARELHTYSNCAGALFIALTGYNSADDRVRSTAAGFDHHFSKPANLSALIAALGPPGTT